MVHRRTSFLLLLALTTVLLAVVLSRKEDSALRRAELMVQDSLSRLGRHTPANPKLIFLAIDSDSIGLDSQADLKGLFGIEDPTTLEGRALAQMSQQWPWPRSLYALVLERLIAAGARVVAFDLIFPTPKEEDPIFAAALEKYADKVIIGSNFTSTTGASGRVNATLTRPSATLIPKVEAPDPRVGFVNFWPDADGVIRSARTHTSLSQFIGAAENSREPLYSSLASLAAEKSRYTERAPEDISDRRFRFTNGPEKGFPPRSIFEIFVPAYWAGNYQSGSALQDAIVVVGAAGNWQHDEHNTPFGVMGGPEIQLNVVNALLHQEFIRPLPTSASWVVWLLAAGGATWSGLRCSSPLKRIGLLTILAALLAGGQILLFDRFNLAGPLVGPLLVLSLIGLFSLLYDLVSTAAEQIRLRRALIERKRSEELLRQSNEELERRVTERTAKLTEANSRMEGMLQEKDVLLKEIHHRVKNNLQIISSLLNLQSSTIEDKATRSLFTESRNRVRSMALIHEKLYQSHDLGSIDFQDYLKSLTSSLASSFGGRTGRTKINLEVDNIMLGVDAAVPCGLIVNELVTNCYKHAFKDRDRGEITVSLKRMPDANYQLSVADDGVGLPKDLDLQNTESLGMQIVTTLSEQLNGSVTARNGVGSTFEILFPEPQENKS